MCRPTRRFRQASSPPDRVDRRRSGYHQTGGSENSPAACLFDGFVDGFVQAKIIGSDD